MTNELILVLVFVMILGLLIEIVLSKGENKVSSDTQYIERLDYSEVMGIINETISNEFQHKCHLEYKLKNVKMFYDFEKELREISLTVMDSFSQSFIDQAKLYHTDEYLSRYITRTIESLLIEYSKKNKPKTK